MEETKNSFIQLRIKLFLGDGLILIRTKPVIGMHTQFSFDQVITSVLIIRMMDQVDTGLYSKVNKMIYRMYDHINVHLACKCIANHAVAE